MVKNVGSVDRVARLCVAALLAFLAFTTSLQGWGEIIAYVVAGYLALTALFGSCVIYRMLDVDSVDTPMMVNPVSRSLRSSGGNAADTAIAAEAPQMAVAPPVSRPNSVLKPIARATHTDTNMVRVTTATTSAILTQKTALMNSSALRPGVNSGRPARSRTVFI